MCNKEYRMFNVESILVVEIPKISHEDENVQILYFYDCTENK